MNRSILTQAVSPWILFFEGSPGSAYEFAWRCADEGMTTRVLRGSKMCSEPALFDELGAALQFPDYFGENWPAAVECSADLAWMPAGEGYVLVITEADLVLSEEAPGQIGVLVKTLTGAAESWAVAVEDGEWWDRPAVPFHIVLQASGAADSTRSKWSAAGEMPVLEM
jgi:hypothetical protein